MTRDERQDVFLKKFVSPDVNGQGCLEATPAFGKTRCALNVIKYLRRNNFNREVIIIVPNHFLKEQWDGQLSKTAITAKNTKVLIINSAVKMEKIQCSLLILDEIHRYASNTFSKIFEIAEYKFILGLTGTIKRLDGKHKMLKERCPIIDVVTTEEARINGWIAPYMEFNLKVELSEKEKAEYLAAEEFYDKMMDAFQWDFGLMMECSKVIKPRRIDSASGATFLEPECVKLARKYGWKGNTAYQAWVLSTKHVKDIWGGDPNHTYHPMKLQVKGINGRRQMQKIKRIINNSEDKLLLASRLFKELNVPTITFCDTIARADKLARLLGPKAISYHSKTKMKSGVKKNEFMREMVSKVESGEILGICTAKSLDEGADFPDVRLGVRLEGTSSSTQHTQRRGRIVRKNKEESAVMVNLYVHGTKEVQWLSRAQNYADDVVWVDSYEELINQIILT